MTGTGATSAELDFVSTGPCPGCDECRRLYGYDTLAELAAAIESGECIDEGSFSWGGCDDCDTGEGGNRYIAHGRDKDGAILHFDVCEDCMFAINGL